MPKMKSNSAAKKRFRVNKNGVVKRGCQYAGHKMTNKTSKRKMRLRQGETVSKADAPKIKEALQGGSR
ncbi:MAG: 50S ribosomal protein L35 [Clostridia bacterium]|nr:50S ribosomal protein L35 [Clostridia bacterium]